MTHKRPPSDRAIVSIKTQPFVPSKGDYGRDGTKEISSPRPRKEGRWWVLYYREDDFKGKERSRPKKRQKLAPIETSEREVKKIAAEFLRPDESGPSIHRRSNRFRGVCRYRLYPRGAATACEEYPASLAERHQNPPQTAFAGMSFRDMTALVIDRYFTGLGSTALGRESIDKIRDALSAIMISAIRHQLILKNPVEGVRLPRPKHEKKTKPWITLEQFFSLLEMMQEHYATIVYLAMYTGLRPSEIAGLRWRNVHEDSITIDERYCQSEWGSPKSEASNATIAVNKAVIERIQRLKTLVVSVRAGRGTRRYPS